VSEQSSGRSRVHPRRYAAGGFPRANARRAIATGVVGGMLSAAILSVLLVPVFYVLVRQLLGDRLGGSGGAPVPARNYPGAAPSLEISVRGLNHQ